MFLFFLDTNFFLRLNSHPPPCSFLLLLFILFHSLRISWTLSLSLSPPLLHPALFPILQLMTIHAIPSLPFIPSFTSSFLSLPLLYFFYILPSYLPTPLSISPPLPPHQYPARPKLPDPFQPKSEIEVIVAKGNKTLSMHLGKYVRACSLQIAAPCRSVPVLL